MASGGRSDSGGSSSGSSKSKRGNGRVSGAKRGGVNVSGGKTARGPRITKSGPSVRIGGKKAAEMKAKHEYMEKRRAWQRAHIKDIF